MRTSVIEAWIQHHQGIPFDFSSFPCLCFFSVVALTLWNRNLDLVRRDVIQKDFYKEKKELLEQGECYGGKICKAHKG